MNIDPVSGRTPLQVRVRIAASPSARPGIYGVDIAVLDAGNGRVLASSRLLVIVVGSSALAEKLGNADRFRRVYREKGIQYAIVYALNRLGVDVRFSDIKLIYELVVGRNVSNGTVGDLLKRLVKKGILKRVGDLYYLAVDLRVAKTVMDLKRARNGLRGALRAMDGRSDRVSGEHGECYRLPQPIKRVLKMARELLEKDYWLAVDFIAHTLVGVRKTGAWILWFKDYFIYHENKTGLIHYFKSQKLSSILRELDLKPGVMTRHEHHLSEKYIIERYGSYTNARRIHYLLKELGWFEYGKPLLLELSKDYLSIRELSSSKTLLRHGDTNNESGQIKTIVYGGEHIDEENELTYFL
ncbi:MAG: hypothetical protein DRO12_01475 [Thermoprotei archaeon]|nr:MAG: hypothetical protein DRO12_01475 [Thermoprotei archaeon]